MKTKRPKKAKKQSKTTGTLTSRWPCELDCVGVETWQIPEAMAEDTRLGVPVHYNPETGAPRFESAKQRKAWSEAHGYYVATPKGTSSSMDPVRLSQRERENRGYTDTNRLQFIGNQQKFSANWTKIDWSKA